MTGKDKIELEGGCACGSVRYRVTAMPGYYPIREHWPKDSLVRLQALK